MKRIWCGSNEIESIKNIFNEVIENTTSLYDYGPRSFESVKSWLAQKSDADLPVIGYLDSNDDLLGFGYLGPFRDWPAYKYTTEHSIYIKKGHRGQGIGKAILTDLIHAAEESSYHVMVAGIDSRNSNSIALHKRYGFTACGTVKHAGFKFGEWINLSFYQLILSGPKNPKDG